MAAKPKKTPHPLAVRPLTVTFTLDQETWEQFCELERMIHKVESLDSANNIIRNLTEAINMAHAADCSAWGKGEKTGILQKLKRAIHDAIDRSRGE